MRHAIIQNGVIVNVVELDSAADYPGAIPCPDFDIGDTYAAGVFAPRVPTQAELDKLASDAALAQLAALDLASIRDIRAYIAGKADAPKTLKDREAEAVTARGKVKP